MAPGINLSVLATESEISHNSTLPLATTKLISSTKPQANIGLLVLHPSYITQDFDELRFGAAAARQLDACSSMRHSTLLVSSPYNQVRHHLDLLTLDTQSVIFAKALTILKPMRADYATASYLSSLNFDTVLNLVNSLSRAQHHHWTARSFYVVVFRSKLQEDIDNGLLYKLDYESHREACESGGLLKYWFGKLDGERQNLATCFWRSRQDAHQGGLGPWHAKARAAGRKMYEHIQFSTHKFTVLEGADGFTFEDWADQPSPNKLD